MHRIAAMVLLSTAFATVSAQNVAPNAAADKTPVRVSGGVMAALILKMVTPMIPAGVSTSGGCVMHAIIAVDGHITKVDVISSNNPTLGNACAVAVKQWVYKPYMLNGEAIPVETTVTLVF